MFEILVPKTVDDAVLLSSSVPETDWPEWNSATNYTAGSKVIRAITHKIYENLIPGIDATSPENATGGASPRWLDLGATNRWAMFDEKVGTSTSQAGTITVVLNAGKIAGLGLLQLVGEALTISGTLGVGGPIVYSKTIILDGAQILNFYDWFFLDKDQLTEVFLSDIPSHYADLVLSISITPTGGTAGVGVCKFGPVHEIGGTQYGVKFGIDSYSKKTRDSFGAYSITKREFSKRSQQKLITDAAGFNKIARLLSSLDSVACIFSADSDAKYQPLVIYGFYKTFEIDVAYVNDHYCTIEVEGLI